MFILVFETDAPGGLPGFFIFKDAVRHEVFSFFFDTSHSMIDPTRMAVREKIVIGILRVPCTCKFSIPINPPSTSRTTPTTIPTPLRMMEIIVFTPWLRLGSSHHTKSNQKRKCEV